MRPIAATFALVLIAAALPQFAAAQDDGVFFDPGGPSDKEYAMPHVQARDGGGDTPSSGQGGGAPSSGQSGGSGGGTGSGGGSATPSGSGQAVTSDGASDTQVFGEGVTPAQRNENGASGSRSAQGAAGAGSANVVGLARASADGDSTTAFGWFAAIAAAVALLGGGLAYVTRARTRGPAT